MSHGSQNLIQGIKSARAAESGDGDDATNRLPEYILISDIFCRLVTVKDVAMARCVCKRWKSLLSSSEFLLLWHERPMCTELWFTNSDQDVFKCIIYKPLRFSSMSSSSESLQSTWEVKAEPGVEWFQTSLQFELASSHGLLCWAEIRDPDVSPEIWVGNPRTGHSKLLPAPLSTLTPISGRFLHHDLLQQKYKLFLFMLSADPTVLGYLFDSCSMAWQHVPKLQMPPDRLSRGLLDGSVSIINYSNGILDDSVSIIIHSRDVDKEKKVEPSIAAYDSCSNSWDRITVSFHHPFPNAGIQRYVPVSASCKDRPRLIGVDVEGETLRMNLWQLDEKCTGFELMSTFEVSWKFYHCFLGLGYWFKETFIVRSDDKVFMALILHSSGRWFVAVYDVEIMKWKLTDSSFKAQECRGSYLLYLRFFMYPSLWSSP